MDKSQYGLCLLHNRYVDERKAIEKCRALKPYSVGIPYQRTRKDNSQFRCRHLIILKESKK